MVQKMAFKPIDAQHFYIDDHLIDLVWISHQIRQQTNAANYHDKQRNLSWLHKFGRQLAAGNITEKDEAKAREKLISLGYRWYFDVKRGS
jgi:hypothetical protein